MLLLPHPLEWLSPEEPDDPGSNELRVAAKERGDPGELPLLLRGEPGDPAEGVVDQEWPQEEARPFGVAIVRAIMVILAIIELGNKCEVTVHIHSRKEDVEQNQEENLLEQVHLFHCQFHSLPLM